MMKTFIKRLRKPWEWSMDRAKEKLLEIDHVYDVLLEQTSENHFLVHIWHVGGLGTQGVSDLSERIKNVFSRRPRGVKVDVRLYERSVGA